MDAAGLEPEPFDVPIHLGPGMPPTAHWIRSAASEGSASSEGSAAPEASESTGSVSA